MKLITHMLEHMRAAICSGCMLIPMNSSRLYFKNALRPLFTSRPAHPIAILGMLSFGLDDGNVIRIDAKYDTNTAGALRQ